ncbi:hypothetical protein DEU56DRAFT_962494 [Suillus clintonianus]|uniref:uncharacterized protein n=1 Tax=Suillus clintonianus TaxID=1904413 RepID=UPI001B85CBDF|nr:uncharacterized protein DEU56DRAFT_962494 [Suillus clintonianus]KAG2150925.1 hypothetical protein DEU56DRAFT_962494 [Suillus clintonianus]
MCHKIAIRIRLNLAGTFKVKYQFASSYTRTRKLELLVPLPQCHPRASLNCLRGLILTLRTGSLEGSDVVKRIWEFVFAGPSVRPSGSVRALFVEPHLLDEPKNHLDLGAIVLNQMKACHKQQKEIAHIKKFIASAGTYANLVKQAKSKQKIIDRMEAQMSR